MRAHLLLALGTLALVSSACSSECELGTTRACYNGPDGTMNVGSCRAGIERCGAEEKWTGVCEGQAVPSDESCDGTDNDCNGSIDEGVRNVCGGCPRLGGTPGDPCEGCGRWACEGTDKVVCVPPLMRPGAACDLADGCPGIYRCGQTGDVTCFGEEKNACGVCGGPDVDGIGESCTGPSGCAGTIGCTESGFSICRAPLKNNCGACDAAPVAGVNQACTGASGCTGVGKCDDSGLALLCEAPEKNACGVCGGPAVEGIGEPCGGGSTGLCEGVWGCNAAGTARECKFENAGVACTGDSGCEGTVQCAAGGSGTVCVAPTKNACGACGGPEITGIGDDCTNATGCEGVTECNVAGTGTVCRVDASCVPTTDHVVISEFATLGASDHDDEFVELYNPTNAEVSLSGWKLWYRAASNSGASSAFAALATFPATAKIAARGYFLVARPGGYSGPTADLTFASGANLMSGSGGQLAVTANGTQPNVDPDASNPMKMKNAVDFVGFGSASRYEGKGTGGSVAPKHEATPGGSVERKAHEAATAASMGPGGADEELGNGLDTQNNGADFVVRAVREPQNSHSPTEP